MEKKRFLGAAVSVAVLLSGISAFATVEQIGDETVTISGSTEAINAEVGVQIFAKGKTADDFAEIKASNGNFMDILIFHDQCMTDENGNFTIDADLFCSSGEYDVYVGLADGTELSKESFVYVNNTDYEELAKNINDATASEIVKIVEEDPYIIGLSPEMLEEVDVDDFADVLLETLEETPMDPENREEAWEVARKSLLVTRLNSGKIENICDEDPALTEINESELKDWIGKDFAKKDNFLKNFTERLSNAKASSYGEYKDSLVESFVLATILHPNGNGNIKEVVTAFEDELDVNVTDSTPEKIWSQLAGNDYDISEFIDTFEELSEEDNGNKNQGSSSSSGGGGKTNTKKPAGVGSLVTSPVVDNKAQENQMNPVIFDDIDAVDWAKDAIVYLAERQILDGIGNSKFNPNGKITREQFAKIAVNAFTPEAQMSENVFDDVVGSAWYAPFVSKAYAMGIVSGMGNGKFGVGLEITRQDMCVMIYNAAKAKGYKLPESDNPHRFSDDADIADYAKEAVYALKEFGAVSGVDTENFAPRASATRAQAAKIIYYLVTEM